MAKPDLGPLQASLERVQSNSFESAFLSIFRTFFELETSFNLGLGALFNHGTSGDCQMRHPLYLFLVVPSVLIHILRKLTVLIPKTVKLLHCVRSLTDSCIYLRLIFCAVDIIASSSAVFDSEFLSSDYG